MSGNSNMTKADKEAVINRINSIIREVNETNQGGSSEIIYWQGEIKVNCKKFV